MSRLAKKPVVVPKGVEVNVSDSVVTVKGPKATLTLPLHRSVGVTVTPEGVMVEKKDETRLARALVGTFVAHVKAMISGVVTPFKKVLEINGVGYKVEQKGTDLVFALGFSHPVVMKVPTGITATIVKNVITLEGADKQALGQFAAEVRDLKRPEPYLGKGIKYQEEVIRRKQGKKSV